MTKKGYWFFLIISLSIKIYASALYSGEIMGRDLKLPGMVWAGHVGVTFSDTSFSTLYVIEALNEQPAIKINELYDFKSRSRYWGSRYGVIPKKSFPLDILREAYAQKGLCPEYTMLALYSPGIKNPNGTIKQCAKFRCDTFVNHIFHIGGYNLPTFTGVWPSVPANVFNAFPYGNADGPYSSPRNNSVNNAQLLLELGDAKNINTLSLDTFIYHLQSSNYKSNSKNINDAWKFATTSDVDVEKRLLLIDYIGSVGDVTLLSKMVNAYCNESNEQIKNMLLRSTQDLYQRHIEVIENSEHAVNLENFYYKLLLSEEFNAQNLPLILRGFVKFSSEQKIYDNFDRISNIIDNSETSLPGIFILELKLDIGMKSIRLEKLSVPKILSFIQNKNDMELDDFFNRYLIDRLVSSDLNAFDQNSKELINSYLTVKEPNSENSKDLFNLGVWLEATALINSVTLEEAGRFVADYIVGKNVASQATYIIGLSDNYYMKKAFKNESEFGKFKIQAKAQKSPLVSKNQLSKQDLDNIMIDYAMKKINNTKN